MYNHDDDEDCDDDAEDCDENGEGGDEYDEEDGDLEYCCGISSTGAGADNFLFRFLGCPAACVPITVF